MHACHSRFGMGMKYRHAAILMVNRLQHTVGKGTQGQLDLT